MVACPRCHQSRDVLPLMEAVRRGSTLRVSEYGWTVAPEWGAMPAQWASLGRRPVADKVIGQLKRPAGRSAGVIQQAAGMILGVVLAIFGIPAVIFGLFWLASANVLWLPALLVAWVAGVGFLLSRALRPTRAPTPYRRAMIRVADFAYCPDCDVIFEVETGRVVPVDELHNVLYAGEETEHSRKLLAR